MNEAYVIDRVKQVKSDYEDLLQYPKLLGPDNLAEVYRTIKQLNDILKSLKDA